MRQVGDGVVAPAVQADGLEEDDVLGGAPGIFSAYWAGHAKDAAANLNLLLDQLAWWATALRTARHDRPYPA